MNILQTQTPSCTSGDGSLRKLSFAKNSQVEQQETPNHMPSDRMQVLKNATKAHMVNADSLGQRPLQDHDWVEQQHDHQVRDRRGDSPRTILQRQ